MAILDNLAYPGEVEYVYSTDYGYINKSQLADASVVNRQSIDFSPKAVNANASSWDDVLKFGLARLIDAKTRPIAPQNTQPVLLTDDNGKPISGGTSLFWLAVGGLVLLAAFGGKSA